MSMISMAVYDTTANQRSKYTRETLKSLLKTVDFYKHRIIIVDNGSCEETQNILLDFAQECQRQGAEDCVQVIRNEENKGTAKAINQAWKLRKTGEHCVKMDNDVVIHSSQWLEEMETAIKKDRRIGIIGLKRKDVMEFPEHPDENFRSKLIMLDHQPGEAWLIIEAVGHCIGTCQMYNSDLLDKIGYLYQPGLYGFDDVLAAYRANASGFYSAFIPHIKIDHIDLGGDNYTEEKRQYVGPLLHEAHKRGHEYLQGIRPVWEDA